MQYSKLIMTKDQYLETLCFCEGLYSPDVEDRCLIWLFWAMIYIQYALEVEKQGGLHGPE